MTPYNVVRDFEQVLCDYAGAPYAVTTNSCTMALFLSLKWHYNWLGSCSVMLPSRTYVSVPMSAIHAGHTVRFDDYEWQGAYDIYSTLVVDSARRFTSGMYVPEKFMCVSFHASKILGDTQGGAILHDDPVADKWFRKARVDGRTEGVHPADDTFDTLGYHCHLSPDVAARLLLKLSVLPKDNEDLPNDLYPDLSKMEIFRGR